MADSTADDWNLSPPEGGALRRVLDRLTKAATTHVRLTAVVSVLLIFACFAAATALQMRRDYAHALALAESFASSQSIALAGETGRTLDRIAALGTAYIGAIDESSAAQIVTGAESDRVLNIALADADGHIVSAMQGQPLAAKAVPAAALARGLSGRSIETYSDPAIGASPFTLLFRADKETPARFILVPLDPVSLLPLAGAKRESPAGPTLGETALFSKNGAALALSEGWEAAPPEFVLRSEIAKTSVRYIEFDGARRIVALSPVPGWPLSAAASLRAGDALESWYGSLPLYLFVILGPALAGAGLVVILVKEFERGAVARNALAEARAESGDGSVTLPSSTLETPVESELVTRLAAAERMAGDAERAKAEFVAHMSHELRTPLNAIIGFAEIIAGGLFGPAGSAKYVEYANDIANAGRGLHARIGDILEYARATAEQQLVSISPVDVSQTARECIEAMRGLALSRDISLTPNLPFLPLAAGDVTAVKRILTILLSNALRYTPDGGAIGIEARQDADTLILSVRDTGYGFTTEEGDHAGRPFLRFERPENGTQGGVGLGLAVAMALARRMGGALRLEGSLGEGTWAELRLPITDTAEA